MGLQAKDNEENDATMKSGFHSIQAFLSFVAFCKKLSEASDFEQKITKLTKEAEISSQTGPSFPLLPSVKVLELSFAFCKTLSEASDLKQKLTKRSVTGFKGQNFVGLLSFC
jgi:hypothetical protein